MVELANRLLVLAGAGLTIVYLARPELVKGLLTSERIERYRRPILYAAIALVVLNLLPILLVPFRRRASSGFMLSRSPGGQARVSVHALRRSLSAAAHSVPDISRTRLAVHRLGSHHFKVVALYWIPEGENAITLGERLRLVLKRRLGELVALGPKDRVDIAVDLAGMHRRRSAQVEAPRVEPAPRPQRDFHGPVYPVDGVEGA
jgi:hypothetical protein